MQLRLARNRLAQEAFLASLECHRKDGNTFGKPRAELAEGRDEGIALAGRASFLRADSRSADSIRPPTSVHDVWCPDSSLDREVEEHKRMAHPIFHPDSAITRSLPPCCFASTSDVRMRVLLSKLLHRVTPPTGRGRPDIGELARLRRCRLFRPGSYRAHRGLTEKRSFRARRQLGRRMEVRRRGGGEDMRCARWDADSRVVSFGRWAGVAHIRSA
ncbi:hypothetical protein DFH08DRAFT_969263 [Mycena albidolilacea]|uniref:Uncharacterized protein n=1 Tax=Mycena albidolilacea TaxID=1033008 RepID=A0AAD6ZHZ9_9AGAR|nr:hypothetical protein DFH08DRAFT_969263 [Mycena albidolilacea]